MITPLMMLAPYSTPSIWPLMKRASSLARNGAA